MAATDVIIITELRSTAITHLGRAIKSLSPIHQSNSRDKSTEMILHTAIRHGAPRASKSCLVTATALQARCSSSSTSESSTGASQEGRALEDGKTTTKSTQQVSGQSPKRKTMAELDEEMRAKMSGLSGDAGEAGIEYEDGQPVAMKRSVKNNSKYTPLDYPCIQKCVFVSAN